ncbi:hypothetical protein NDU88_007347 [Pleurodeles waltl]|uniref:Uncharacterized protein n=1 Tax=Pleurodeles waltl TaxID=8319 RepID=A0AAV7VSD0_PLEWA|nr:hypothetical protein NDU88_007347 [Pleurodeles waltl]
MRLLREAGRLDLLADGGACRERPEAELQLRWRHALRHGRVGVGGPRRRAVEDECSALCVVWAVLVCDNRIMCYACIK